MDGLSFSWFYRFHVVPFWVRNEEFFAVGFNSQVRQSFLSNCFVQGNNQIGVLRLIRR